MLTVTRLNHDSSWLVTLDGTRLLVDPWLEGPAIVGLPAIHRAELGAAAVPVEELPPLDAVLLSHPYPDHTQAATLRRLPTGAPVVGPPISAWFARLHAPFERFSPIRGAGLAGGRAEVGRVAITYARGGWFDPTHNVLALRGLDSGATLLYCPHGMVLGGRGERAVDEALGGRPDLLLISFTHLDLPGYLGGVANLGDAAALEVIRRFRPRFVASTHDGDKPDTGFIAHRARITRGRDIPGTVAGAGAEPVAPELGRAWSVAPA